MKLPNASELDRAKNCPASCVLPRAGSVGAASSRGQAIHEYLLRSRLHPVVPPAEYREFCESIDKEALPDCEEYEIAFAYDTMTGYSRRYDGGERKEGEIIARVDMLDQREHGNQAMVYVADLKTGRGLTVEAARDNLQLGLGALCAARDAAVNIALVQVVRVKENGAIALDEPAMLGRDGLEAIELEINDVINRVRGAAAVLEGGGQPRVFTGPHCTFCPCFSNCPEQRALALVLGSDPKRMEVEITQENFAIIFWRYKAAQEVLTRVKNALYGYARRDPQPVGKGLRLGVIEKTRKKIDGSMAVKALAGRIDDLILTDAVETHITQAGLRRSLKKHTTPGAAAKHFRDAMKILDDSGAIERTTSEVVDLYRAELEGIPQIEEE